MGKSSIDESWIQFHSQNCTSPDCLATKDFERCGLVECGQMLTAWKNGSSIHYIVHGSRNEADSGTFHFIAPLSSDGRTVKCDGVDYEAMDNCYTFQTRNTADGVCQGVYYERDDVPLDYDDFEISNLSSPVWYTVVSAVLVSLFLVTMVGCQ